MKKLFLPFCFVVFLSTGLASCSDDTAEITPSFPEQALENQVLITDDKPGGSGSTTRP